MPLLAVQGKEVEVWDFNGEEDNKKMKEQMFGEQMVTMPRRDNGTQRKL